MEQTIRFMQGEACGNITVEYCEEVNYAYVLSGGRVITRCVISCEGGFPLRNIELSLKGKDFSEYATVIREVPAGGLVSVDDIAVLPERSVMMRTTEPLLSELTLEVRSAGAALASCTLPLTLMPFDQWGGISKWPELLASFVTPNAPAIAELMRSASNHMLDICGNDSLSGYRTSPQMVVAQVEAAWRAIHGLDLNYSMPPSDVAAMGQRIRTSSAVLSQKMGTCLDLSLLFCSLLEQMGLNPCVVLMRGHAFPAVWINPSGSKDVVRTDQSRLIAQAGGYETRVFESNDLLVIEATCLTQPLFEFSDAVLKAREYLVSKDFEMMVDIAAARKAHIRPIPEPADRPDDGLHPVSPSAEDDARELPAAPESDRFTEKVNLWERKLLDLTVRNPLINLERNSSIVPLKREPLSKVITCLNNKRLSPLVQAKDVEKTLRSLYRSENTALEESGADPLFLALGTLKWYDEESRVPRFAPIILIPVMVAHPRARVYELWPRDEEPMINVTLIELLKQVFDLELQNLSPLPMLSEGMIDTDAILEEIRAAVAKKEGWEVVPEAMLGIFSFSKFVMWHDLHSGRDTLAGHKIITSLTEGHMMWEDNGENASARELDRTVKPSSLAVPLDVDSSQLEAIAAAGEGHSFVLYGPPGTGKSQTITNMIANALYHGQKVLFVSEKKAALEVVKSRLDRIGLSQFTLELHSNKMSKSSFLAQLEDAMAISEDQEWYEGLEKESEELFKKRQELNAYVDAISRPDSLGLSLSDYVSRYLSIMEEPLDSQFPGSCSVTDIEQACSSLRELDTVCTILGRRPETHPLLGLLPLRIGAADQRELSEAVLALPGCLAGARKKYNGLWNRNVAKKSLEDIVMSTREWSRLTELAAVDASLFRDGGSTMDEVFGNWCRGVSDLRLWYQYSTRAMAISRTVYGRAALSHFLGGRSGEESARSLSRGFWKSRALSIIDSTDELRIFNGYLFDDAIALYKRMTEEFQMLTRRELYTHLATLNLKTFHDNVKGFNRLRRHIAEKGKGQTIRTIINGYEPLLRHIVPCMLMSPLSVAQYLDMNGAPFDLVIFDEASQMPTCEAVGAIVRSKSMVVVGDPKQMPPTNFFNVDVTSEEDSSIEDLESILDDSITLSMPSRYLKWHYRSRHESLIAFSNATFYDGRLITFPSADEQQRHVRFVKVDGFYDFGKSRSNRSEARAIVDEVIRRLTLASSSDRRPESIGVVAFSKAQSSLIDDMLVNELSRRPELDDVISSMDEPVFVKNLENVQGDERDVILFSVGYGPDRKGRVSMNFGPINLTGGERRLNVAVTRARSEMMVFSTLEPEMIDLERTASRGVYAMKRFLEYAKYGTLPVPHTSVVPYEPSPVALEIAKRLRESGYGCDVGVGCSGFRIDVAVKDPTDPARYDTAILIDSPQYCNTPTARDRELVRSRMLQSLGWKVRRIWMPDLMAGENIVTDMFGKAEMHRDDSK